MKAKIIGTEKNKRILSRYLQLANEMYVDAPPEQQIVVGHFLTIGDQESSNSTSVKSIMATAHATAVKRTPDPAKHTSNDIRSMFKKARENSNNKLSVVGDTGKDGDDVDRSISID